MFKRKKINKIKITKRKNQLNLDEIPSSNRRMEYYKKKRKQKRIKSTIFKVHTLIRFILIALILWCASKFMVCRYWYVPQSTFDTYPNENLHIIGNKITPNEKIIKALKTVSVPEKPIYLINTTPYEKEIEKLSPVKKAFVRRYWLPARFEVTIEEQIPVVTIAPNPTAPEIAAITLDGEVITKDYLPISDKKYETYKILTYDDYTKWTKHEILFLQILAQRIEDYSEEKLVYLDIRNKKDIYAQLETTKIRIGELNSTLKARIERLTSIMPQIENLKRQTDYVDIRWDNTTFLKKKVKTQVTVRKKVQQNQITENNKPVTTTQTKKSNLKNKNNVPLTLPEPPLKLKVVEP